jgi:hypothetical protein
MSGIGNYHHGERGTVLARKWTVNDDYFAFVIQLSGDPYREFAQDYASDIGIDPKIQVGDDVVYVRLGQYAGLWVKANSEFAPALEVSLERRTIVRDLRHRTVTVSFISKSECARKNFALCMGILLARSELRTTSCNCKDSP